MALAAIIQARMGSTRLPGKTMANIGERPLIQHLVERILQSSILEDVIIATTVQPHDDVLEKFADNLGLKCYRGSEHDLVDRFYQAAQLYDIDPIVRVTPDCPLLDPQVMDDVIRKFYSGEHDYVTNTLLYTYPEGLDVEVFSREALESVWKNSVLPSDREHVTPFMRNSGKFRVSNVENSKDLSHFKWSVDTATELEFVRTVFKGLTSKGNEFNLDDILGFLASHPEVISSTDSVVINEGYYHSLLNDAPVHSKNFTINRSISLKDQAGELIPSYTQTFSKGPSQFVQGISPVFLSRGVGSHTWDVDNNEFIDYVMGLGPIVLGHNYSKVNDAVKNQMEDGVLLSLAHPIEVQLANLLTEVIPCAEMVRFGKNGSDATAGAVRVARARTGRDIIACCGYHGWQDWFIGTTSRDLGVPDSVKALTKTFNYNDINSLKAIFDEYPYDVAAVIMEPIGLEAPENNFLAEVKDVTRAHGALLIFDEIITGFRLALGGAQQYFNVIPDLACFGKAMANGYPLSAVVGKQDIMRTFDDIFYSFTFGGETLSMAAALCTINEMQNEDVIGKIWSIGNRLKDGYNTLAKYLDISIYTQCVGLAPHSVMSFQNEEGVNSLELKSLFQQECIKRGILTAGYHNISYSHTDSDIDYTLRVYRTVLEILKQAIMEGDIADRYEGEPIQPIIRET